MGPFSIFFPIFPGFLLWPSFPFCKWPLQSQYWPEIQKSFYDHFGWILCPNLVTLPSSHRPPPPFRLNPALKRSRGRFLAVFARFRPFSADFGQKTAKIDPEIGSSLRGCSGPVLGGAGEGFCGWKSGTTLIAWKKDFSPNCT